MLDIKKLKKQVEKDLEIDKNNLMNEIVESAKKQSKYLDLLRKETFRLHILNNEKEKVFAKKYKEIKYENDLNIDSKSLPAFIKSSEEYKEIYNKYLQQKVIVDYLENVIDLFKQRSFYLNSAVKLHIFLNGG